MLILQVQECIHTSISFRVPLRWDPVDLLGLDAVDCFVDGEMLTLLDKHEVISYPKKKTKSPNQGEPMIHTPSCSIRLVEVLPITKADEKWLEQELTGIG
jgi:hypothetical protein